MQLAKSPALLLLSRRPDGDQVVGLFTDLATALAEWTPTTRVSPVFGFKGTASEVPVRETFPGPGLLFFIGPIQPLLFCEPLPGIRAWASVGAFNLVIYAPGDDPAATAIEARADALKVRFERWTLLDGVVNDVKEFCAAKVSRPEKLSALANTPGVTADLADSVSEFCALAATTWARASQVCPALLPMLEATIGFVSETFAEMADNPEAHYSVLGLLVRINAGLSRLSSQALSGSSPIRSTESHYWIHSLLGTGVANIALHNIADFAAKRIVDLRIPERLANLRSVKTKVPNLLTEQPDFWHANHLEGVAVIDPQPTIPLITFLSGRDGFHSNLTTLSAPLAIVSSCNTIQWSLLILTHELSHVLIRGVLNEIYPDPNSVDGAGHMTRYLQEPPPAPVGWLEAVRFNILDTVIGIQGVAENYRGRRNWTFDRLANSLARWHDHVEEIMVHVFDFLYFYAQDTDRYIQSIWFSWAVIPDIGKRVPEYLMRTLCVALTKNLRRGSDAEDVTRQQVLVRFAALEKRFGGPYVEAAIELLKNQTVWEHELRPALTIRKNLVKLVRGFLYWDVAAAKLRRDATVTAGTQDPEGYGWKVGTLPTSLIGNPIRFVESFSAASEPSASDSLWLLTCLAFNLMPDLS
jgi:hypothetical protein